VSSWDVRGSAPSCLHHIGCLLDIYRYFQVGTKEIREYTPRARGRVLLEFILIGVLRLTSCPTVPYRDGPSGGAW